MAGPRRRFQQLASDIDRLQETNPGASDLIKIEDFRVQPTAEKLKPLQSKDKEPLLEVNHMMLRMMSTFRIQRDVAFDETEAAVDRVDVLVGHVVDEIGAVLPKSTARYTLSSASPSFRSCRVALLIGRWEGVRH